MRIQELSCINMFLKWQAYREFKSIDYDYY